MSKKRRTGDGVPSLAQFQSMNSTLAKLVEGERRGLSYSMETAGLFHDQEVKETHEKQRLDPSMLLCDSRINSVRPLI